MASWHNQVALVTGGACGIGRAIVHRLVREGASVCVNHLVRPEAAESLVADIGENGGRAIAVAADVADDAAVEGMVDRVAAVFGPVTVLVNTIGISTPGTLDTFDPEKLARMRQVNVNGMIHTTRAVMSEMRRRKYGRIVNITSIAALDPPSLGTAFYAATQAEVHILTQRFASELGPYGITVNIVGAGLVPHETAGEDGGEATRLGQLKPIEDARMMRRIGEPDDIANAVAFLASPDTGWVTAQMLIVDGGRMHGIGRCG